MTTSRKAVQMLGCCLFAATMLYLLPASLAAQVWDRPIRGSWVAEEGLTLVDPQRVAQLVVPDDAHSAVRQAATFLAQDIETITGRRPEIVTAPAENAVTVRYVTLGEQEAPADLPQGIRIDELKGKWEAYQILTTPDTLWLIGSDARGTAFASYTLSERLGIDPLYIWTGYRPERRQVLSVAQIDHFVESPTFKDRGLFHDDEDILPRPFEFFSGYPLRVGTVPTEWYARFFETALRLRMNMVAPYTRTFRRFEVQKMASDWGLFYTSHHYDILLSNPFGYNRFNLARKRGVEGDWNWQTNAENMIKYWRAGVEENGELDCIWPVGLRGTEDYAYPFPEDMPEAEQNRIFQEVIQKQIDVTRELIGEERTPVFHFTLYGEMLDKYLDDSGQFEMPEDVILIWCDDNDGRMRALPKDLGKWKHGVYYHLAYYGHVAKQSMNLVPPRRIANEFKRIVHAGATEYMLLNVSELREFVRETRMIADICWDAETALADTKLQPMPDYVLPHVPTAGKLPPPPDHPSPSADRFARWFSTEYFGEEAADDATAAYDHYAQLLHQWDRQWYASDRVIGAINSLILKFTGEEFHPAREETIQTLKDLDKRYKEAFKVIERARSKMNRAQRRFFFENCEIPLRITWRHTQAALLLIEAMEESDLERAWELCEQAMQPLEQLEIELKRAEYEPFVNWYGKTWIRHEDTGLNLHRPYEALRLFLASEGTQRYTRPDTYRHPNVLQFLPLLEAYE